MPWRWQSPQLAGQYRSYSWPPHPGPERTAHAHGDRAMLIGELRVQHIEERRIRPHLIGSGEQIDAVGCLVDERARGAIGVANKPVRFHEAGLHGVDSDKRQSGLVRSVIQLLTDGAA